MRIPLPRSAALPVDVRLIRRRSLIKAGVIGGAGALAATRPGLLAPDSASAQTTAPPTPFKVTPFKATLPLSPVLREYALETPPGYVYHGIAPEFDPSHPAHAPDWNDAALKTYKLVAEQRIAQIIPGVDTPVFTYRDANAAQGQGTVPGPTIIGRFNEPIVVRQLNRLTRDLTYVHHDIEASIHHHGGHNPAHADGHPGFYTLPGRERDYYYPNIVPKRLIKGVLDFDRCTTPSTMWYHDHSMDITGFTVSRGLNGYYLGLDDLEQDLIDRNVLPDVMQLKYDPENCCDIPLMFTDQRFNADGTLHYDFLDHDGRLGDVFTVNGAVQPKFHVQRRQYRLRFCNGSNARYYQLRMSTRRNFLQIGKDSWLFPLPIDVRDVLICPGERADVIVDFRYAPDEVFLENIMQQTNGRKPDGPDPNRPTPMIKFVVEGDVVANDLKIDEYTELRPHEPIKATDIVKTRVFEFERGNGAWQINGRFFNPRRADAVPQPDNNGQTAERWILKNGGGGWFHPIHIHLEHMEVQKINGRAPSPAQRCKSDIVNLEDNATAEIFMRFRTFTGPFVFHCHIVEHEDMRMMAQQDPRKAGDPCPLDGEKEIDPAVSGVPLTCEELEPTLFFEAAGDVDRLEGRGVGVPCDDFERGS
jgi:FtsP/CotA-like multicopper oxidase with cupredoxin domain